MDAWAREREWLANLKPGDMVAHRFGFDAIELRTVERRTTTQIHLQGGSKFRAKDGRAVGASTWDRTSICEPTAELRSQLEERKLRRRLEAVNLRKLSFEKVLKIIAIIEGADAEEGER